MANFGIGLNFQGVKNLIREIMKRLLNRIDLYLYQNEI
jgi:hypothetical protein